MKFTFALIFAGIISANPVAHAQNDTASGTASSSGARIPSVIIVPLGESGPAVFPIRKGMVVPQDNVDGGLQPVNLKMPAVADAPLGSVVLIFVNINENGNVTPNKILLDAGRLGSEVKKAAREWKFNPPTAKGVSVRTVAALRVSFPGAPAGAAENPSAETVNSAFTMGKFHLGRGEYDEAIADFRRGLTFDPSNALLTRNLEIAINMCKKENELFGENNKCGADTGPAAVDVPLLNPTRDCCVEPGTPVVTVISGGDLSPLNLPWRQGMIVPDYNVDGGLKPVNLPVPAMRDAPVGSMVLLKVEIEEDGTVIPGWVVQETSGVSPQVKEAARSWRFQPPTAKGKPVRTATLVKVFFPRTLPARAEVPDGNRINMFLTLGKFHYDRGEFDEAIEAYQRGLTLDPSNSELQEVLTRTIDACRKENALLGEHFKCGQPSS